MNEKSDLKRMKESNRQSVINAFNKIKEILDKGDVEDQFKYKSGDYHSKQKFIVSWNEMWKGMVVECSVDKSDAFYTDYSGHKAIYVRRNLLYEKQIKGYPSIEYALIDVGLKLCPKKDRLQFFNQYAIPYNERVKSKTK